MIVLFQGFLLGLSISLLLGPILFLFIDATTIKGYRGGLMIALGAWMSDLMYLTSAYFAYSVLLSIIKLDGFETRLGLVGGVILVLLGLITFFQADRNKIQSENPQRTIGQSYISLWLKGFLVNTLNPFCAFFWIGAVSTLMIQESVSITHFGLFALGSLGTIVVFDLFKILAANKILVMLSERNIIRMKKWAGAFIFFAGAFLIFRVM